MNAILLIKIKNIINYFITGIIIFLIKIHHGNKNNSTLLLIRLDSIGDYILLRNFLKVVRESEKHKKYKITLCGNSIWKDIAEEFDKEVIDEFLWIDRNKFYNSFIYKYRFLRNIYNKGFEVAVDTTFTREILYGDSIVKASNAKVTIGSEGSPEKHAGWKRRLLTDKYYTRLIPASENNLFEFFRNKNFFEALLGEKIELKKPDFPKLKKENFYSFDKPYVVIFPGAAESSRRWDTANFSEIVKFVIKRYDLIVVIAGGNRETEIANSVITGLDVRGIANLSGTTSLLQLIGLIQNAEVLISNETGAVHISAAVNTPFVCISNGNHFGRFNPYPDEIFDKGYYVYPPAIINQMDDREHLSRLYRFGSNLDINSVDVSSVNSILGKLLNKNDRIKNNF